MLSRRLPSPAASPRASTVTAAAALASDDEGDVEEEAEVSDDDDLDDFEDDSDDDDDDDARRSTSSSPEAGKPLFAAPTNDPLRPWELDVPTIDDVLEDPDWPTRVGDWPKFWAMVGLWRQHLLVKEVDVPLAKEEKRNPRARLTALDERALRLAPPDGAEDVSAQFADGVFDYGASGAGGEGGGGGGDAADGAGGPAFSGGSGPAYVSPEEEESARFAAHYARERARETARIAALPPMTAAEQRRWRAEAGARDEQVYWALCTVHKALPGLARAGVPLPEYLQSPDDERAAKGGALGLPEPVLKELRIRTADVSDAKVLPTYHTGGRVGGTNQFPGPREKTFMQTWTRTKLARDRDEELGRLDPTGSGFLRADMEEEELARRGSAFADGVIQHEWASWGDVELRAWNEKRRAHARADAAFAARQAEVGKNKAYNVDELTDLRLARKVKGFPFKLTWTHDEIMGVITNGGQNVHPDLAAPALGVVDSRRNLDYFEEGVHAHASSVAALAVGGVLADDESGLPDLSQLERPGMPFDEIMKRRKAAARKKAKAKAQTGKGGGKGSGIKGGKGGDASDDESDGEGGVKGKGKGKWKGKGDEAAAPALGAAEAASSSAASAAPRLPFPTAAAASADLAETFAGLDEMAGAGAGAGVGVGGGGSEEEEEEDEEGVLDDGGDDDDDDGEGSGSHLEIGGIPGIDVDPEFDEEPM